MRAPPAGSPTRGLRDALGARRAAGRSTAAGAARGGGPRARAAAAAAARGRVGGRARPAGRRRRVARRGARPRHLEVLPRGVGDRLSAAQRTSARALGVSDRGVARPRPPAAPQATCGRVEVVADLAAMALERAATARGPRRRRARDELRLKRAAEAVSGSLELDEVHRRVVDHAAQRDRRQQGAAHAARFAAPASCARWRALDFSPGGAQARLSARRRRRRSGGAHPPAAAAGATPRARRRDHAHPGDRLLHARPARAGPAPLRRAERRPTRTPSASRRRTSSCWCSWRAPPPPRSPTRSTSSASGASPARSRWASCPSRCRSCPGYETGLLYAPAPGSPPAATSTASGGCRAARWRCWSATWPARAWRPRRSSAMVRFFVEARSWDETSPAAVLEQANSMLAGRLPSDSFVTAFLGVLSPGSLRYANAGHLPPLHRVGRASVRSLEGHGLPLGVDGRRALRATRELALDARRAAVRLHGRPRSRPAARARLFGHERLAAAGRRACAAERSPRGAGAARCTTRSPAGRAGSTDDAVRPGPAPPLSRAPPRRRHPLEWPDARSGLRARGRGPVALRRRRGRAGGGPRRHRHRPARRARRSARATTPTCCASTTGAASRCPPTAWARR